MRDILAIFHEDLSPEHPSPELQAVVEGPKPGCSDRIIARIGPQCFQVPAPGLQKLPPGSPLTIRCVGDTRRKDPSRADYPLAYMVADRHGKIKTCLAK